MKTFCLEIHKWNFLKPVCNYFTRRIYFYEKLGKRTDLLWNHNPSNACRAKPKKKKNWILSYNGIVLRITIALERCEIDASIWPVFYDNWNELDKSIYTCMCVVIYLLTCNRITYTLVRYRRSTSGSNGVVARNVSIKNRILLVRANGGDVSYTNVGTHYGTGAGKYKQIMICLPRLIARSQRAYINICNMVHIRCTMYEHIV